MERFVFSSVLIALTVIPLVSSGQGYADIPASKLWLLKTDSLGDTVWTRTYGGDYNDLGLCVEEKKGGGNIVLGLREPTLGDYGKIWLLRTDSLGDTLWTNNYAGSFIAGSLHLQQTDDGGCLIIGKRHPSYENEWDIRQIWALKVDSLGDSIWMRSYGKKKYLQANDFCQTGDGNFIIMGSIGEGYWVRRCKRAWLLKIAADGSILWEKGYGWLNGAEGYQVQEIGNNQYSVIARKGSKLWRFYTDTEGQIVTSSTYSEIDLKTLRRKVIKSTSDSGCIFVTVADPYRYSYSNLVKINSEGKINWQKRIFKTCMDLKETYDGGYVLTGYKSGDVTKSGDLWLLKIDAEGQTLWNSAWGEMYADEGQCVQPTHDGGYIIVGNRAVKTVGL